MVAVYGAKLPIRRLKSSFPPGSGLSRSQASRTTFVFDWVVSASARRKVLTAISENYREAGAAPTCIPAIVNGGKIRRHLE
jgi:hypothetical protein